MIKVVTFFLIGIVILAVFGKLRIPKIKVKRKPKVLSTEKCKNCGVFLFDGHKCDCKNNKAG